MYHDMAEEGKGYFPSMKSIRGSSFPEETARLTEQLANPEFLSRLTAEAAQFAEDARENRNLLRFPFHNPETILNTLKELAFPRRDYDSLLAQVPKPDGFITEDEIDDTLSSGSNMSGGKRRIYQYFTETPARSMTEKANFLKDEYGIGGRSPAVSGADGSNEAHDSKGIVLQKNGCAPVKMQWTKAAARIDTLIRQGQYLTQNAMTDLGRQEADEPVSAEESAALADAAENPASSETAAYAVGDTVYLDDTLFVIEAKSAFGVQLRDPSQRYPIFRRKVCRASSSCWQRTNGTHISCQQQKLRCGILCLICPPAHPNSANQRPNRQQQKTSALRMSIWGKAAQRRNSVRTSKPFPC